MVTGESAQGEIGSGEAQHTAKKGPPPNAIEQQRAPGQAQKPTVPFAHSVVNSWQYMVHGLSWAGVIAVRDVSFA
jgi:hypothetical protein